ncbi:glycosyltransferase N-terminal domain-containing protein [Asaia krungthepensis]|uniref:3-deoxy-D-manno-octulosonic acid transferase n=1 Tax=Asaia krungthepensis NRIC 0535 TaxID=1307925 RepID=A0ABQ0Q586_9PROT|nr:glycosyltransferase N-terminal domain-containing protein [Asaia krungthepensis]GBQ92125.1 3-deoxy-D-manno-octulosonic-acid transferase [Asaia krungthepensis NRIC 0535]
MNRKSAGGAATRALLVLARGYLAFALRTTRWTITGAPDAVPALTQSPSRRTDGAIVAAWHETLLMLPAMCRWGHEENPDLKITVMISRNRDGRFINDLVAPWGIIGVEGSSDRGGKNKGGSRALRQACAILRDGAIFALTPDGPRGPARIAQRGTETLMRLTGKPLVPVATACLSLRLPTWDRLRLPLPFGRGYLLHGQPCETAITSDEVNERLDRLTLRADRAVSLGRMGIADIVWRVLGVMLMPALRGMMLWRLRRGKERHDRLAERRGRTAIARPEGEILWLHAASVGEANSILPLLGALAVRHPRRHFLVTTATLGGADIVAAYQASDDVAASRLIHQFIPYDVALWTKRFLDHWKPSALLLTDSELWPGLILACMRRAIPVAVLNGRLSARSWQRWQRLRSFAPRLFERLDFVAARGEEDARHFRALGVRDVSCHGDLKQSAPPPPVDQAELVRLRAMIGERPVFLAASTHPGEEEVILRAAAIARRRAPTLLTIIAPRHPVRGEAIAALAPTTLPRRSLQQEPDADCSVWIADTLGELGLFYRLSNCAFIGNSLFSPGGGHNPFEPVRLDVILASGPHCGNFRPAFAQLDGLVSTIHDEHELAGWIDAVLNEPLKWQARADAARAALVPDETVPPGLLDRIDALCG